MEWSYDVGGNRAHSDVLEDEQKYTHDSLLRLQRGATHYLPRKDAVINNFIKNKQLMEEHNAKSEKPKEPQFQLSVFYPVPYKPCTTPLANLGPAQIKDLKLEWRHKNCYVMLRVVKSAYRTAGVVAVGEDLTGNAVRLELYQQEVEAKRPAATILHEGAVVVVKEPLFQKNRHEEYIIRVDHVNDIVFLPEGAEMIPPEWAFGSNNSKTSHSANEYRVEGNALFKMRDYWGAISKYTAALKASQISEENTTIRLNRAQAYLNVAHDVAALQDTGFPAFPVLHSEKALYRAGQALYRLRRFDESKEVFLKLMKDFPQNEDGTAYLRKLEQRLRETKGIYDFKDIYEELENTRPPHLDRATYIGPVAKRKTADKGNGLFTTRDVKAGELLLCEKAFTHCYSSHEPSPKETGITKASAIFNRFVETSAVTTPDTVIPHVVSAVIQKLLRNPAMMKEISSLHHGSYKPNKDVLEVDASPVIDTFLIERIISLNCFAVPLSSLESLTNGVSEQEEKVPRTIGFWLFAAAFNHECTSNALTSWIGDLLFVRAACNIPADTEVTIVYNVSKEDSHETNKGRLRHWGFECQCPLCLDAKLYPEAYIKREEIQAKLDDGARNGQIRPNFLLTYMEKGVAELASTYISPPTVVARARVFQMYRSMMQVAVVSKQYEKVIRYGLSALTAIGFEIQGAAIPRQPDIPFRIVRWGIRHRAPFVDIWLELWMAYALVAPILCCCAEEAAKTNYRMFIGEDWSFEETLGKKTREEILARKFYLTR